MKRTLWSIALVLMLVLMPVLPARAEAQLDNITDQAGLLQTEQWQTLEQQARDISQQYGVGVYILAVEDYLHYTDGQIEDAADAIYTQYDLGVGEGKEGILLMLSMAERDYLLMPYGTQAAYAFSASGREYLDDFFLDDFGSDAWAAGFADYLKWSADYLKQAEKGKPYSAEQPPMTDAARSKAIGSRVLIILLLPFAAAGIDRASLKSKLKSVEQAQEARTYMTGALQLRVDRDLFTHTTEKRRTIEKKDSGAGTRSGSGGGATKGKF